MTLMIAISGAHGSGKTTLVYAIVAALKQAGYHAGSVQEVARESHYLICGVRNVEMHIEVAGLHMAAEMRASREYDIVISDRSLLDFLAFSKLRFSNPIGKENYYLVSLRNLTHAYASTYDRIYLTTANYNDEPKDTIRSKETIEKADFLLEMEYIMNELGIEIHKIEPRHDVKGVVDDIIALFNCS